MYTDAYKCYQLAHLWRESLYTAMLVPLSQDELTTHATDLATTLVEENKDYLAASQIHAEHLHDIPTAARLLCRGARYSEATRLLTLHSVQSLIPEIVDVALADAMGSMTDLLADFRSQLQAQVPRIAELRVRRIQDPLAYFGGDPTATDGAAGVDIPDNVSLAATDASTLAGKSMFTRYTGKTSSGKTTSSRQSSRNRRKEERKRARGKKGTVYEEEYLVNSVRRLIERVGTTVPEVENLVDSLLRRGMRERAAAIEKATRDVLKLCEESQEEVFIVQQKQQLEEGENGEQGGEAVNGPVDVPMPQGGQRVFWESIVSTLGGGKGQEPPKIKEMKKSALLS
jgi:elongator complex protein 1